MNIHQTIKQSQFHQKSKSKKISSIKSSNHQIQMNIGIVYNQIIQILQQNYSQFKLPLDGVKTIQKLQLIKQTVEYFVMENGKLSSQGTGVLLSNNNKNKQKNNKNQLNQSNMITCSDCQNYQNNLQKLENDVRQHIRLQQQLKIYQQGMEQKIQQLKKQKSIIQKKYQQSKKKIQQLKTSSNNNQKLQKLQYENQRLKSQLKLFKHPHPTHHHPSTTSLHPSTIDHSKKIKGYQSKQNKLDWVQRMSSIKKDQKQKSNLNNNNITDRNDRKSIEKKGDSTDRWRMSTTRSTKVIQMNDKIIQDKSRKDREKALQAKFQYRR